MFGLPTNSLFRLSTVILFLIAVTALFGQIQNRGFDLSVVPQDSSNSFSATLPLFPDPAANPANIHLQYKIPQRTTVPYYDPHRLMPKNQLFLDYRGGSYYVPRMVNNRLAQIMKRPSPDSFVPILAVAYLAIKIAAQYVDIEPRLQLEMKAYVLPENLLQVLVALLEKSPQTVPELFRKQSLNSSRTEVILQQEIDRLLDMNLIKIKQQEQGENLYFSSQKPTQVLNLIESYYSNPDLNVMERERLAALQKALIQLK